MSLLTSRWGLALFALLIHFGISTWLVLTELPKLGDPLRLPPDKTELAPRLWSFKTKAVDELIDELRRERENLAEEHKNIAVAQAQLAAEKAEVEKVRAAVQSLREEIDARVVEIQTDELQNLKSLAQTYSAMPPPAAVAIVREMDEAMAVKLLALMKADRVGPILGEMAKAIDKAGEESMAKRAARISDKLRLMKPVKKQSATAAL